MADDKWRNRLSRLLSATLLIALVGGLLSCAASSGAKSDAVAPVAKIKVPYSTTGASTVPLIVASEAGMFKKNGLDVEPVRTNSGSEAVATLISGEGQIGFVGGESIVNANLGGSSLIMFGAAFNRLGFYMMGQKGISSLKELKGKNVGIASRGGSSDAALKAITKSNGIDYSKDIVVMAMGQQSDRVTALDTGSVAAVLVEEPFGTILKDKGYSVLLRTADMDWDFPRISLATTKTYLSNNEDVITRFLKGMLEGEQYIRTNKTESIKIIGKFLQMDDPKNLEAVYTDVLNTMEKKLLLSPKGVANVLESAAETNPKAKDTKPEDFYDSRIIKKLDDSGFIK